MKYLQSRRISTKKNTEREREARKKKKNIPQPPQSRLKNDPTPIHLQPARTPHLHAHLIRQPLPAAPLKRHPLHHADHQALRLPPPPHQIPRQSDRLADVLHDIAVPREDRGAARLRQHDVFLVVDGERRNAVADGGPAAGRGRAEQLDVEHEVAGVAVGAGARHVELDAHVVGLLAHQPLAQAGGAAPGVLGPARDAVCEGLLLLLLLLGVVELQVHGDLEAAGGDVGVVEDRVGGEGGAEEERGAGEEEDGLQVGAAGGLGEGGVERGEGFVLLCEGLA